MEEKWSLQNVLFLLLFNKKYLQKPPTKFVGFSVGNSL
jgi:hypothetical protein